VVGEAADGVEAITQFRKHQPDITLMDLRLPRMGGVDVIQRLRMETPHARFIVLTTYDGDEDIYRALQAGARAYLLKGMTSEELIATIRAVHAGKSHIPPAIAEKLAERMGTEELTPREFDVLEQIVHGKSNKEIATELEISEATVKTHINSLLGKLGVTDRTQAATAAIQRGIVPLESLRKAEIMKSPLLDSCTLLASPVESGKLDASACRESARRQAQKTAWRQATDAELGVAAAGARAGREGTH
jgi:DNA-binding NarL/FixJ family response regulator